MKRFAVFAGDDYYPSGGMGDYKGSFDTVAEAEAWIKAKENSPKYPSLFASAHPKDAWAREKFGKFDWCEIEDMDARE